MELQRLTVFHYSENPEEERRITLSPMKINVVAAKPEDIKVAGRSLREIVVLFEDGSSVDLLINHADLEMIEAAVGTYCIG